MTIAQIQAALGPVDPVALGVSATAARKAADDTAAKAVDAAARHVEFSLATTTATSGLAAEKAAATLTAAADAKTEADKAKAQCSANDVPLTALRNADDALKGIQDKADEADAAQLAADARENEAVEKDKARTAAAKEAADAKAAATLASDEAVKQRQAVATLSGQADTQEGEDLARRQAATDKEAQAKIRQKACDDAKAQAADNEKLALTQDGEQQARRTSAADNTTATQKALERAQAQDDKAKQLTSQATLKQQQGDDLLRQAGEKKLAAQAKRQEAAQARLDATRFRAEAQARRQEATDSVGLAGFDHLDQAELLDQQALASDQAASGGDTAANALELQATDFTSQAEAPHSAAADLKTQAQQAGQASTQAKADAKQSKEAAEQDTLKADAARDEAKRLRAEAVELSKTADSHCAAAKSLREQAKGDLDAADAAKGKALGLREQAGKAGDAALAQDKLAADAGARETAQGKLAAAAEDEAKALRKLKQQALDKSTALKQEVADAKAAPAYTGVTAAQADLNAKTQALVGLAGDPLAAQQAVVEKAKHALGLKALALNAAEVKAELAKAKAVSALADIEAHKFGAVTATCPQDQQLAKQAADDALTQAKAKVTQLDALDKKLDDFVKLEKACDDAATSLAAAVAEKDTMVTARMAQLRLQGHGPQRHCDPSDATQKKRAVYGLDPETGSQIEGGRLHVVGAAASTFKTPDDYVKAEAAMRAQLMQAVCPLGVAGPTPVARKILTPALTTVFPVPDNHVKGFAPSPPLAKVLTTLGAASPLPPRTTPPPLVPAPVHPAAPTFPPLVVPAVPAAPSNALLGRYQTMAEAAVKSGADPQTEVDALAASGGGNPAMNARIALLPASTVTPPLAPADQDQAAITTYINTAGTTTSPSFNAGTFTAIFDPVDVNNPCGEWKLLTLYPNP